MISIGTISKEKEKIYFRQILFPALALLIDDGKFRSRVTILPFIQ
jgi:hypothetical protein